MLTPTLTTQVSAGLLDDDLRSPINVRDILDDVFNPKVYFDSVYDSLISQYGEITDEATGTTLEYAYCLPYFYSDLGIWTGLALANRNKTQTSIVNITVYDQQGNILSKERKTITALGQTAFPIASHITGEGWILVNSHQPLSGLAFLGDGALMADIPVSSELFTNLIIPHIAQNEIWDTKIMICNPNSEEANISIKFIDQEGRERGTQVVTILGNGSRVYPLSSTFVELTSMSGRIEISSSLGITAFALYSNLKSNGGCFAGINAEPNN